MIISPLFNTLNQEKYAKHYWNLCNKAMFRELPQDIYTEKHHMFPKCLVGDNNLLIHMTPEEHYVAHQLLIKMYPNNTALVYAARMMTIRPTNKLYGWLKRKNSAAMTLKQLGKPKKASSIEKRTKTRRENGNYNGHDNGCRGRGWYFDNELNKRVWVDKPTTKPINLPKVHGNTGNKRTQQSINKQKETHAMKRLNKIQGGV